MPFKFSRCICLQTPQSESAARFYREILGVESADEKECNTELIVGTNRLFIDKGEQLGPILEFLIPDLESAKKELIAKGCEVVVWEGSGGRCYMRDPFGLVFNLYEDKESFSD